MKLQTTLGAIALLLISLAGGYYYWSLERTLTKQEDIYDETTKFPSAYKNEERGIQLTYPAGWQLIPAEESGDTVATFVPESSLTEDGRNEVIVATKNLDGPLSLDEYTTNTVYAITQELLQAKIVDSQAISLQNEPAHQVIFTAQENGKAMKYLQVWQLKDNRSYTITYKAQKDSYDDFSRVVRETIIDSFKIIPSDSQQ